MATQKYLLIYREPFNSTAQHAPSPQQMEQLLATWNAWKEKFKAHILDMGDGLKPTGKVLASSRVTDGPFIEGKEVVGGFSIVQADSYEKALSVAKECPVTQMPGTRIEIREMMGF